MNLYFDCTNGISGDMTVAALLDLGCNREKLKKALDSINLKDEFKYEIKEVMINSIKATDFNVILLNENKEDDSHHNHINHSHHIHNHHHNHRNLEDVCKIIDSADTSLKAKDLAKRIFEIVAQAESKVHNKDVKDIHFHEIGAIDSIVDILSFSVLFDDLNPEKVYFSTLSEGQGIVQCQHGALSVPVPAVCEIASQYQIPIKITSTNGEMITPTGIAIAAALFENNKLENEFIIEKTGYGAGKRKYSNPILRIMKIK